MKALITADEIRGRVLRAQREIKERGLDALVAFSGYQEKEGNVCYLTGHHSAFPPSANDERMFGLGYTAVLLTQERGPVLFTMNAPSADEEVYIEGCVPGQNLVSNLLTKVKEYRLDRGSIGIAGTDVVPQMIYDKFVSGLPEARIVPADEIITRMRMVKSPGEIEVMKVGAQIADEGFKTAFEVARVGLKEREVASQVIKTCMEAGADWIARVRIYSGVPGAQRWPLATDRRIASGDIVGMDLVGWYGNYAFDVLRFWTIGSPTAAQRDLLESAVKLTEAGVEAVRVGSSGDEVSVKIVSRARELGIESQARPWGHAIGIEVVELPYMVPKSSEPLREGMVFCVEPIVSSHLGRVSFEDELVVRSGGPEVISKFPKVLW
ncbi:MAG: Xaa-Pro peptidase family protein [Aigarchaeota archaeon]|nr:Xaa-Pro peptidase family protein [Aigarchaeota archaeon]MDW8092476.1 Xaa-Pro peptidase family protein [Nitrososphaerota archaeon]